MLSAVEASHTNQATNLSFINTARIIKKRKVKREELKGIKRRVERQEAKSRKRRAGRQKAKN